MTKHYDVIVVGAGSMGMAAGYYLAKQGVKVLLVDSFDPPHDKGSHYGDTRIIRHAYGEGREYVPLALRSQVLWDELEKKTHHKIFMQTGAMGFGKKGDAPFIDEGIASGKEYNLEVEHYTGAELKEHYPGLQIPDDYDSFYEPKSGFLFSENCIQAYRDLAEHHGAEFSINDPVRDIEAYDDSVKVITEKGAFTADKLVISAGSWSGKITSKVGLDLPLIPTRQPVAWFEADESLFNANAFPTFMVEIPNGENRAIYYGFPSFGGCGVKVGRHEYVDAINPDTMNREFGSNANDEGHIREFLDKFMPKASGALKNGVICMYTRTPDGHFIIDKHPEHSHISIAAGFSGHGFKFASVVGEILSQLAVSGETDHDISIFRINRPSLQESSVTKN
ncbi:monomeric sarcosine oxidase [Virgibacillus natechei]|uniref:Monomeric sarcosine oxidase n=1 Tax=Virgibacillus natechei TaxID=1216297 RepID=A0ABS4IDT0_9BACI|nr:N-methyl-L-tryptophan oxidase [Virgibacillus natechei]MBP1969102.1 monomeric sarcosine oxidase [Virgibacillus natechei]UZD14368.1 N-methyl-L-tryptophan oxidase [Virgibacillus natechei]